MWLFKILRYVYTIWAQTWMVTLKVSITFRTPFQLVENHGYILVWLQAFFHPLGYWVQRKKKWTLYIFLRHRFVSLLQNWHLIIWFLSKGIWLVLWQETDYPQNAFYTDFKHVTLWFSRKSYQKPRDDFKGDFVLGLFLVLGLGLLSLLKIILIYLLGCAGS